MTKIYICDDDEMDRLRLRTQVSHYAERCFTQFAISEFTDASSLLTAWETDETRPALIFLDILMTGMDGLELAERLRQTDREVPVIFTSSSGAYGIEAFRVFANGYLKKPYTRSELYEALKPFEAVLAAKGRRLSVRVQREYRQISLCSLIYLEANGHDTIFHTTGGDFRIGAVIKNFRQQLASEEAFLVCGKSYVVNLYRVRSREGNIITMENGGEVYIPVRLKSQITDRMGDFYHVHGLTL